MARKKLFGNNITPSCDYCKYIMKSSDGRNICMYGNKPDETNSCKKYIYDPLKREPKAMPTLPTYTYDDFKI